MSEEQHHLALPPGTRIRDFEFHRVLGRGGFGITYLGRNTALDIPVAIKEYLPVDWSIRESDLSVVPLSSQDESVFQGDLERFLVEEAPTRSWSVVPPSSQDESDSLAWSVFHWGLNRFRDEAHTLAWFEHPNIVRVHHFFEAHSTAYIAMDYVEGEDLSAYLTRKGTLSEAELKDILYPLLDALEVIHGADFLHRDIKPGNIVLRKDGSPVLLDFGAARQAIEAKSRPVTSIVTPKYAPIEQYEERGPQGPWTDIYALGAVCYRALTGQVPDDATVRVRKDPLVPVSQQCAGQTSQAFLAAIDKALQVAGRDRPKSVAAWREALGDSDLAQARRQANLEGARERFVAEVGREPSPDAMDDKGMTDLHYAAKLNLSVLTLSLIKQGAAVDARCRYGLTPLHVAAQHHASLTAGVLLEQGAKVNAINTEGHTPLHVAGEYNASSTASVLRLYGARE